MSRRNYFVLCKNCKNKIDLGAENPLQTHMEKPSLTLDAKCKTCGNNNSYDLHKDLNLL